MSNHEWTSQRHWQHWVHKTQDEKKNIQKDELHGPHQNPRVTIAELNDTADNNSVYYELIQSYV